MCRAGGRVYARNGVAVGRFCGASAHTAQEFPTVPGAHSCAAVGYPAYVDGFRGAKSVPFGIASHQPETLRDAAAAQTRIFTLFVSALADGRRRAARAAVTSARAASRSQETPYSKPLRCEAQATLSAALQNSVCPPVCPPVRRAAVGEKPLSTLQGNSFSIPKSQLFCLLGPNGAGKTTTINCLTGVLPIDSGDARHLPIPIPMPLPFPSRPLVLGLQVGLHALLSRDKYFRRDRNFPSG